MEGSNFIPSEHNEISLQTPPPGDLSLDEIARIAEPVAGGAENIQGIYPLSPLQEGMLFQRSYDQRGGTLSLLFELPAPSLLDAFVDALNAVIARHDSLRTAILWEQQARPLQLVHRQAKLPVEHIQMEGRHDALEQLTNKMRLQGQAFDLSKAPLMRLHLAADKGRSCFALLQAHLIVCDHQSLQIVAEEAVMVLEGREHDLPPPVSYREHVAEVREEEQAREALAYFRNRFADVTEATAPFGLSELQGEGIRFVEFRRSVDLELVRRIRTEARRHGTTPATLVHAAWGLVVARTSGKDDIVYGTRLRPATQKHNADRMLGMTVNTLPLRLKFSHFTAQELVEQTHRELLGLIKHQQTSLVIAQRCSGMDGTVPLFTTLLDFRSVPSRFQDPAYACVRLLDCGESWTGYPIALSVEEMGEEFLLTVQTDGRVDPLRLAGYVHTSMHSLVDALAREPRTPAWALRILPEAELRQTIGSFNPPYVPRQQVELVYHAFEVQVARTPNAPALVHGDQVLTYAEVNTRAGQLASYLLAQGLLLEQRVGLCVERSVETIIGLLAILKAGGAYVPVDPDYPAERLAHILEDASPKMLLTQAGLRHKLSGVSIPLIFLDQDSPRVEAPVCRPAAPPVMREDALAYVIYTSGSTGRPKGVMIQHHHILNLHLGLEEMYRGKCFIERVALNASLNFDASVQQLVHLLRGRAIYVVPQDVRSDPAKLRSFVETRRIEAIDCTPSQLKTWLAVGLFDRSTCPLRLVLVGGEPIDPALWKTLAHHESVNFYNVYGPTECTVDATAAHMNRDSGPPHIGQPMQNRRVYVLAPDLTAVPIGVAGEIHIGGEGIARGYLDRPSLTAERFVADPFVPEGWGRMYKTGDLGRWRADGQLEYLGRNDQQVKIRGFRVELGDIEAQLIRHASIREAVVLAREDEPGDKRLAAYVVPRDGLALNVEALRTHMAALLPEHMIPSVFVTLEQLPLTPSGKLNRQALPAPNVSDYTSVEYEPPQTEMEQSLADIWKKLLRVERVGRQDNFFELGGDSLLVIRLVAAIRASLGVEVSMGVPFEHPTIAELSAQISEFRRQRLLARLRNGDAEIEDLVETIASMQEKDAEAWLEKLNARGN